MKGMIFTYALTYGGALMSLFYPYYGLLIYICFSIMKPEAMWPWSVSYGNYSRIVAIAMLLGWAGHGFGKWSFGRATLPVFALLGYYLWGVSTWFIAPEPELSRRWVESLFKIVLPFVVGITLIKSKEQLKQIAWVIVVSLGYVAWMFYWSYVDRSNLISRSFASMDNNTWSIAMVCGAGLAFFMGLHEPTWRRWIAFFCAGLMAHVPMFGDSRGGMLALLVTGVVAASLIFVEHLGWITGAKSRLRPMHFAFLAVAVVIGMWMAGEGVRKRFSTMFVPEEELDESAKGRLVLWGQCYDLMIANPMFGVGADHFPTVVAPLWQGKKKEAHSLWLQTGAELGFPGLLFLLTFYGSVIWRLWKLLMSKDPLDPWIRDAAQMVIAALIGFAVSASFVSVEGVEPPYYVALIGAGLLKLSSVRTPSAQRSPVPQVGYARAAQPAA